MAIMDPETRVGSLTPMQLPVPSSFGEQDVTGNLCGRYWAELVMLSFFRRESETESVVAGANEPVAQDEDAYWHGLSRRTMNRWLRENPD